MHSPVDVYQQRLALLHNKIEKLRINRRWTSWSRVIFFLAAVSCFYFYFKNDGNFLLIGFLFIALFFIAIRIDTKLNNHILFTRKKRFVNENELAILNNEKNSFSDGASYNSYDRYLSDLDVFGSFSIFNLLNRCSTSYGLKQLAMRLSHCLQTKKEIEIYQQAVGAIAHQLNLREDIIAYGLLHEEKEGTLLDISTWLTSTNRLYKKVLPAILRFLLPVLNIAFAFYWITNDNYFPFAFSVGVSWLYLLKNIGYVQQQHGLVTKKQEILQQYASILKRFSKAEKSKSDLVEKIKLHAKEAHAEIKKLSSLTELFDQRLNVFAFIILNSLLLYDLQIILSLEKWKEKNNKKFSDWIRAVADIEYIVSLAAFKYNNPGFCMPEIKENTRSIIAKKLSHPLIKPVERVYNDFTIGDQEKLMLVTGSNMSGKSTFLRSIGVNVILAQCGAPVCADAFSFSPMLVLTCMRVNDDLEEHTSYFMAELKKLQSIIHALKDNQFSLVLIDEILRGTNSDDKHFGSAKYIEQLIQFNCLSLFATHDLMLGKMEDTHQGQISNYCFESLIENNELLFDYTLRKGIAKNKNASFLMKKMEII